MNRAMNNLPERLRFSISTEEELMKIIEGVQDETEMNVDTNGQISDHDSNQLCPVCSQPTSLAHKCNICFKYVHAICGQSSSDEGYGKAVTCNLCFNPINIKKNQERAYDNLTKQAKKMLKISNKKFPRVEVGTSVKVAIPAVDRGKSDAKNIIGIFCKTLFI